MAPLFQACLGGSASGQEASITGTSRGSISTVGIGLRLPARRIARADLGDFGGGPVDLGVGWVGIFDRWGSFRYRIPRSFGVMCSEDLDLLNDGWPRQKLTGFFHQGCGDFSRQVGLAIGLIVERVEYAVDLGGHFQREPGPGAGLGGDERQRRSKRCLQLALLARFCIESDYQCQLCQGIDLLEMTRYRWNDADSQQKTCRATRYPCGPRMARGSAMDICAVGKIRLYELVLENGCSASPFVWRIRYALAHKSLQFESVPIGFTDIPQAFGGRFKTVPVIEHGGRMLAESWDIAEYIDRTFPANPALFSGAAEHAMIQLMDTWFSAEVLRKMFGIYALDVHNAARPQDRGYFRLSREARLKGTTLETFTANRESRLAALRESLMPLRGQLSRVPFLGGAAPNYADYIALGAFHWVASVSTLPLLARDDNALRAWLDRCFDLYGGLGRDSRMRPLFE